MGQVLAFKKPHAPKLEDYVSDEALAARLYHLTPTNPLIVDIVGDDVTCSELTNAIHLEETIRLDLQWLDQLALCAAVAPERLVLEFLCG
jgi:hypothetical protein